MLISLILSVLMLLASFGSVCPSKLETRKSTAPHAPSRGKLRFSSFQLLYATLRNVISGCRKPPKHVILSAAKNLSFWLSRPVGMEEGLFAALRMTCPTVVADLWRSV